MSQIVFIHFETLNYEIIINIQTGQAWSEATDGDELVKLRNYQLGVKRSPWPQENEKPDLKRMEMLVLEDLEITDMVREPDQIQRIYQNYNIGHRFAQPPLPPIKKKLKHDKFSSQGATSFNKDSRLDSCTPSTFFYFS